MRQLDEGVFIEILKAGVRSCQDYMMRLTDYHGAPATTEYLLTADIARAFLDNGYPAEVEFLYRKLVTAMNMDKNRPLTTFGKTRADVAVVTDGIPKAIVEVKISGTGQSLGLAKDDLTKVARLMKAYGPKSARSICAAVIFQTSFASRAGQEAEHIDTTSHLEKLHRVEQDLRTELAAFASSDDEVSYELIGLLEPHSAVTATQKYESPDDTSELGQAGHVVQYHAVILRSSRPVPLPRSFKERLQQT